MRASVVCERNREQVSLQLDGELSELERRMFERHLGRCADCRAYAAGVVEFTTMLRETPPEPLERPVVVRHRRRISVARLQVGVAAALAIVALGLGTQLATSGPVPELSSPETTVTRFPTQAELDRELAILERLRDRGTASLLRVVL